MDYFNKDEFKCKCGCGMDVTDELKEVIVRARHLAQTPFIINSGARCEAYNKTVGGTEGSAHTKGLAVDIKADNNLDRAIIHNALCRVGILRFGMYSNFIHADIDLTKPTPRIWLGK